MAKYSELIKNFDKVRDYMRDFFIYGYKTRSDFEYKSLRTYDNEKRRIESWLSDFINFDTSKKGKQVSLSCDGSQLHENPLYNAYRSKSFTDNDIELHFFIIDSLINSEPLSVDEIADKILSDYNIYYEPQTIRIKLKEYAGEGIVNLSKKGKSHIFQLSDDTIENICSDRDNFLDMIKFFSQSAPFGVVGNYILKQNDEINKIFLMKHNFIVHTLEDNIMLELIKAIDEKKIVEIINFGKSGNKTLFNAVPIKFHVSLQTGRRYIVMYVNKLNRFNSFRLDYIKKVKLLGTYTDYDEIVEKYNNNVKYCWGASFGNRRIKSNSEKIKLTIYADEQKEKFIPERLIREGRGGTVTHIAENTYVYETEIFDACEAGKWIKSFIGRIISLESDNEELVRRFYNDIARMKRMYQEKEE